MLFWIFLIFPQISLIFTFCKGNFFSIQFSTNNILKREIFLLLILLIILLILFTNYYIIIKLNYILMLSTFFFIYIITKRLFTEFFEHNMVPKVHSYFYRNLLSLKFNNACLVPLCDKDINILYYWYANWNNMLYFFLKKIIIF